MSDAAQPRSAKSKDTVGRDELAAIIAQAISAANAANQPVGPVAVAPPPASEDAPPIDTRTFWDRYGTALIVIACFVAWVVYGSQSKRSEPVPDKPTDTTVDGAYAAFRSEYRTPEDNDVALAYAAQYTAAAEIVRSDKRMIPDAVFAASQTARNLPSIKDLYPKTVKAIEDVMGRHKDLPGKGTLTEAQATAFANDLQSLADDLVRATND